ncbi:MAG: hypothetical protein V8S72_01190 [Oscillospiraceae bacterium]
MKRGWVNTAAGEKIAELLRDINLYTTAAIDAEESGADAPPPRR